MITNLQKLLFSLLFVFSISNIMAQDAVNTELAKQFVISQAEQLQLSPSDIDNILVSDAYINKKNGLHYIYLTQSIDGIPIHNSIMNVVVMKNNEVKVLANRWITNAASKVSNKSAKLAPNEAIEQALVEAEVQTKQSIELKEKINEQKFIYHQNGATQSDINVKQTYLLQADGTIKLSWAVELDMKENADYWNIKVDAKTGEILDKTNYTVYCKAEKGKYTNHSSACRGHHMPHKAVEANAPMKMENIYRVYALPAESPLHGPHDLVQNPAIPSSSPFGWHDINGQEGAEYTITRGNNVHAYEDRQDLNQSSGNEPDGGADLIFDFEHFTDEEPAFNLNSTTVNLFYMVNMMHDITYEFGFDEAAGSFQANNYGNGGNGNDYVLAEAMDGSGTDNANFATPPDGGNGRMQMYVWNQVGSRLCEILDPIGISGYLEVGTVTLDGSWGFDDYGDVPFTGEAVLATDGSSSGGTQCCNDIANAEAVAGKIALIDRGTCEFGWKALKAQEAGAGACIICNVPGVNGGTGEELLGLGAGDVGNQVTIPTIQLPFSQCNRIRDQITLGQTVTIKIEAEEIEGPSQYNGSFDNGIIAHEYGHGISNRLTAGPGAVGCLGNEEQMGEGWSDFFSLITSVEEGDLGTDVRGVGVYANGEDVNGSGIRTFPYSTDMSINPETYNKVKVNSVPHGVGQVWCAMLWDLYWAMVDLYGWDADFANTESGNHKAITLVMEGMKLQPCSPGFVDGRDAILNADLLNFNGDHQCLIWEVFARRGLGYYADQGSTNSRSDGTEDFEPLPTCIKELKIQKTMPDLIEPGDDMTVSVSMANHREEVATNVVITDEIPAGMTFVSSTASVTPTNDGDMLIFEYGDLESLFEENFEIVYSTDPTNFSERIFIDDIESNTGNWDIPFEGSEGGNFFGYTSVASHSPDRSYYVSEPETESDQRLIFQGLNVSGSRPGLRFFHRYDTQEATDAGFMRVSPAGENDWVDVRDDFLLNGYNSDISYATFAIPNHFGWTGTTNEMFIPTIIDLSAYNGTAIDVQFRYGTDEGIISNSPVPGWFIDDFELIDLKDYESEICISSGEGDSNCDSGVAVINVKVEVSTDDLIDTDTELGLFPNPAGNYVQLIIKNTEVRDYQMTITNVQGVQVMTENLNQIDTNYSNTIDTRALPSGMYVVQLHSDKGLVNKKLVIQK